MKRLSDEEKAELRAKIAEARTNTHQSGKKTTRSWMIPVLVVAGTIVFGVLTTIPWCLSGLNIPPRVEPITRERLLIIAIVVIITVAIPTLTAIWLLVKRWPRHRRKRNKHKVLP